MMAEIVDCKKMEEDGWKLFGIAPKGRVVSDMDLLPPWVQWFYGFWSKDCVECWVKE